MKKYLIVLGLALTSCASQQLVKRSNICITNATETKVYFRDCSTARLVAGAWETGAYGQAKVEILDSASFESLSKRISNR